VALLVEHKRLTKIGVEIQFLFKLIVYFGKLKYIMSRIPNKGILLVPLTVAIPRSMKKIYLNFEKEN